MNCRKCGKYIIQQERKFCSTTCNLVYSHLKIKPSPYGEGNCPRCGKKLIQRLKEFCNNSCKASLLNRTRKRTIKSKMKTSSTLKKKYREDAVFIAKVRKIRAARPITITFHTCIICGNLYVPIPPILSPLCSHQLHIMPPTGEVVDSKIVRVYRLGVG